MENIEKVHVFSWFHFLSCMEVHPLCSVPYDNDLKLHELVVLNYLSLSDVNHGKIIRKRSIRTPLLIQYFWNWYLSVLCFY